MKIATAGRPAHALTVGDRVGWARSRRSYTRRADGRALTALRVVAYTLTSIASLVFLLLVVLAALRLDQLLPGS